MVDANSVTSRVPGLVKRFIRAVECRFDCFLAGVYRSYTDTDSAAYLTVVYRSFDVLHRQANSFGITYRFSLIGFWQEHDEFLSAKACDQIVRTTVLVQRLGHTDKHPASDTVAMGIVYLFEVVDVDHQHGVTIEDHEKMYGR